jgi:two-component system, chemotaxis family, protein-glutamate methylesterase/glutaminase
MKKIRVLIVDDSSLVRRILTEILSSDPGIEVVGSAMDPYVAREKIKKLKPDVITLDVEMPKMDGIKFLSNLMRLHPMPVVMISSLTEKNADITLKALELGAFDFISKPKNDLAIELENYSSEIISKIKAASHARLQTKLNVSTNIDRHIDNDIEERFTATVILKKRRIPIESDISAKIIAIGASTGGTEAIKEILLALRPDSPGIVIAQHIPKAFSSAFAVRMDSMSQLHVQEASDGQEIIAGNVYIAPGDKHLLIFKDGMQYRCKLNDGPPVNRHKPSVDVLFRSVAQVVGKNAIGIILTGMGTDGARGLLEIMESGGTTIAQDEITSVVWGMPGAAVELGAANYILPLNEIPNKVETKIQ